MRSEVQVFPGPPFLRFQTGALAQLGERLLCKQEVTGSIPVSSTIRRDWQVGVVRAGWRAVSSCQCPFGVLGLFFNNMEEVDPKLLPLHVRGSGSDHG